MSQDPAADCQSAAQSRSLTLYTVSKVQSRIPEVGQAVPPACSQAKGLRHVAQAHQESV